MRGQQVRTNLKGFQALIGTAKTVCHICAEQYEEFVSSPHRYCQNCAVGSLATFHHLVSSPHRYCQNSTCSSEVKTQLLVSSPHRYCQNAGSGWRRRRRPAVSSPHRYCQNTRSCVSIAVASGGFQALIGTAKTSTWPVATASSRKFQALIGTAKT